VTESATTSGAGRTLPERAEVVVVGGGVVGVSAAFHLAEAGVSDVVLLEADALGSGSTSKAAGGVRAQFSDRVNIELGQRSLEAFQRFPERPGQVIDLHQVGYLFLLDDPATVSAFEGNVEVQNGLGVSSRMISVEEAQRLSPLIDTDGLIAAAYCPTDGHCSPESVVLGYATGARRHGARLVTHCPVTAIETVGDRFAVHTAAGVITTETVICAAGAWSRTVGEWVGVDLPVTPLRRQVLITEPVADLPAQIPMTIDFSSSLYFHREGPGLLMGMSDPLEQPGFRLDRSEEWLERLTPAIARRAGRILDYGIQTGWAGLYEMTPDHNGLIGEASAGGRFLYATGFSGHGFLMGPAVGEVLRDLYLQRPPPIDVTPLSVTRFDGQTIRPELNVV
jgi:sarcosine oxidase, subunit beta